MHVLYAGGLSAPRNVVSAQVMLERAWLGRSRHNGEDVVSRTRREAVAFQATERSRNYLLPAARIGMVTEAEAASEEASIWQRPSKIPPGSMTMQGECTSPVTTPLA